jgi:predicted Zn-dependent protease
MRQINTRVVRKLTAADGYLELGMPAQALTELESLGDAGPLQPAVDFMTGLALKDQQRFEEAIEPLQKAAIEIPAPHNRDVWLSLGECYRGAGAPELAAIADMFADEPGVPPGWDEVLCEVVIADEAVPTDDTLLGLHRLSINVSDAEDRN